MAVPPETVLVAAIIGEGAAQDKGKPKSVPGAENAGHRLRRNRQPFGGALDPQPVPGAFFDQKVDKRQPLGFVDRLGQQVPVAVIVKSLVLLTHLTPPRTLSPVKVSI